ncbi:hypothetical protein [Rhodococcus xishaensis]|uniref:Uncharacterized protein n=1 Tax=Rhodococcus xishaensis TaxID=2487364 RepID=A0A3S3ZKE4_9NOCA|nr:hypothetical protein [Rhodococcus xishaensis]RVW02778.1 hypothetical protein EGT50_08505 [Rhodococcus xishaensis]
MTYDGYGDEPRNWLDPWTVRALRGLSGIAAGGVLAATIAAVFVAYLATSRDFPGPGGDLITAHVVASTVAVGLQVAADRLRGGASVLASMAVLLVAGLLLWTQWWT